MTEEEKILASVENEQALIGACLRGGRDTFDKVRDIVNFEMFWSTSHKSVWKAIDRIFERGMQIDVFTLGDEMERMMTMGELAEEWGNGVWSGRAYLSDLRGNGDQRSVESYASIVQDYYIKRFLLEYSSKIAYWSSNGRRGKEIIADVENELSRIHIYGQHDEFTSDMKDVASEVYDWTGDAANGKIVGVPSGFIDLDKLLGSMINGNVYLVAARPKKGKTGLLLSIARNVAKLQKKTVGIFSLEMSKLQVGQRLLSQETEIGLQNIIQGKLREEEWPVFTHGIEKIASWPITINDLSSINISQIRQTARRMKSTTGLDLLIVDYIQLAGSEKGKKYERRDLEVSETSRGLKYLARELNVPVLAAAQLSRAVEQRGDKRAILSDLRESGSLEQDAYAVMFLHSNQEKQNIVELEVAAHRNGPTGSCELVFRAPYAKFESASLRLP